MNKKEFVEFHKYLAYLIYDYNETLYQCNLSEEKVSNIREILQALETVMKICIIDERSDK